jgi:hypothetical protein
MKSLAVAAVAVAAAGLVAADLGDAAQASTPNRPPICNNLDFTLPNAVGAKVTIQVMDVAADPDLTPVRLVSVVNVSNIGTVAISDNGTPTVPGDDTLVFTLTSSTPGTVTLYWTISDGSLKAQCAAYASNVPPPDNG